MKLSWKYWSTKNEALLRYFKDSMTKELKEMLFIGITSSNADMSANLPIKDKTKSTDNGDEESERDLERFFCRDIWS